MLALMGMVALFAMMDGEIVQKSMLQQKNAKTSYFNIVHYHHFMDTQTYHFAMNCKVFVIDKIPPGDNLTLWVALQILNI